MNHATPFPPSPLPPAAEPGELAFNTRVEADSMGEMEVPLDALYGASTQRAVLNFPISGYRFGRGFVRALGLVKWAAALSNRELGVLGKERAGLILRAAEEMIAGDLDAHFPLDVFQTGSGTSANMNANEVLAHRAAQLAREAVFKPTGKPGGEAAQHNPQNAVLTIHPNDHVNRGQSSNDVIPTALHVAVGEALRGVQDAATPLEITGGLIPALDRLREALELKSQEFWDVIKIGRTHLMDATPVRLGQEFGGYARQVELGGERLAAALAGITEVPLGGTAVGTGLNSHPGFAARVAMHLEKRTGIPFREARNHFEAQAAKDGLAQASGLLKTVAVSLFKIANDIRWLGSGPRCGIGELTLPATQPGSSIMPGKVNPVMCEMVMQVAAQVIGNDATVTWAAANGNFELNTMMPVLGHNLLESIRLLTNAAETFRTRCVEGLTADPARCRDLIEISMAMVTSLTPLIGYDRAAKIAHESAATGRTVREICREQAVLPEEELERALNPETMTGVEP